jgi:hypothetical protein
MINASDMARGDAGFETGDLVHYTGDAARFEEGDIMESGAPVPVSRVVVNPSAVIKTQQIPFIAIQNGAIESSPLGGGASFDYEELETNIGRTLSVTPSAPYISSVQSVGPAPQNLTLTFAGSPPENAPLTAQLYPFVVVQFSASVLNNVPQLIAKLKFTYSSEFFIGVVLDNLQIAIRNVTKRVTVTFVPTKIVQARPRPLLGMLATGKDFVLTFEGLPATMFVTAIIPGSTHPSIADAAKYGRR